MLKTEFVSHKQWEGYARRVEKKNLKEYGKSLSATGIMRRAHNHIIEIQNDRQGMVVEVGWKNAMKEYPK